MAAIFGHFLKSWEGKFSFQIEDTLSASIPCLFLLIYLAMPQNSETGRRQLHGEDVPKAQMVLKCQTLPEQSLRERASLLSVEPREGRDIENKWEVEGPEQRGGPRGCGWAQFGLTPAGTGDTPLEWRMSCGFSW